MGSWWGFCPHGLGYGKYDDFKANLRYIQGKRGGGEYGSIKINAQDWWESDKISVGNLVGVLSPRMGAWSIRGLEGNLQLSG